MMLMMIITTFFCCKQPHLSPLIIVHHERHGSSENIDVCYLYSDFVQRLTAAMAANTKLALTSLNVSGNVIEEKGFFVYIFV